MFVVFLVVDIPLQSLALPPSLLVPLPLPLPLLLLVPEPLFPLEPLLLPDPDELPDVLPELEPEPLPLPLPLDCWASAEVARPIDRADTARIFKNMVFSLDCRC